MQSSLWKLLTAAGIIGIGTLVVLEVQNRLPVRNGTQQGASVQVTGHDSTVTPDGLTELDRALASAGTEVDPSDPSLFDNPATGFGNPAPPAGDERFYGAMEDQTIRKDELTDDGNPFSMEEPAEAVTPLAQTPASVSESDRFFEGSQNVTAKPAARTSEETPHDTQSAVSNASLTRNAESTSLIPFPAESSTVVAAPTPAAANAAPVPAAGSASGSTAKSAAKNSMLFFPNGTSTTTTPAEAANAPPATVSRSITSTNSVPIPQKKLAVSNLKAVPDTAASAKPMQTVQRVSGTDEEPSIDMFFPEPVPDVTRPPAESRSRNDELPALEPEPFGEDFSPVQPTPEEAPAFNDLPRETPRPIPGSTPRNAPGTRTPVDEGNGRDFFGEDSSDSGTSNTGGSGTGDSRSRAADPLEEPSEPLPFMPDEPTEVPEPFEPDSLEPLPRRRTTEPLPAEDAFPEPQFPEPDRTDRSRSDLDSPFGSDRDLSEPGELLPLPSADDLPPRRSVPDRTDRDTPSRDIGTRGADGRTVSEVMRPQLTIQKRAPNTATVGVSHEYTIVVANEGSSSAFDVIVEDELGRAAELVESKPVAEFDRTADKLRWTFAELRAGQSKEISVRIKPTGEGTLDGIATVRFKAQVKSATVITAPRLELNLAGPEEVKVGDEVHLTYSIRNRGSGDAANVILRSVLPPGLKHPEGGDLEYEIENLRAGDSEDVELTVVAAEPGELILVSAEVTSSGVSAAKARTEIEIVGAQLTLERLGPERRYVGRSAMYQNIVSNESRFEATNATVLEEVPVGMRFVSASNGGEYNPDNRRIRWSIPRIGAGKQTVLEVELVAEQAGQMETIVEVTEDAGFRTPLTENTIVTVEDLHNVTADISRQDEPVAIGARFGFTVTIDNRGTAVARNVELSVQVPAELRVLAAGTRQVPGKLLTGNIVKYEKVLEIQPNQQMTYQLTLQGERPVKNALVQAFLKCDEMKEALIVSESVTVFDDRP